MAEAKYEPRLKAVYRDEIRKELQSQFNYANVMQLPVSYTHLTLPTIYSV